MANTLDTFQAITGLTVGDLFHVKRGTGIDSDVKITEANLRTALVTLAAIQAAGGTANSDTDLSSGVSWFLDEDNMASDDDTKVASQQSVKAYVDTKVAGTLVYKGGYDANTNTPDLTTSPNSILQGEFYVVTVAGTFFTANLEVGDSLIAEQDDPSAEAHWTILQANLDAATIKTLYESNADTNAFTDAEKTNLGNQSGTNTGDMSNADVKTAYEANADTNAFTDADETKLDGIDQTKYVGQNLQTGTTYELVLSDAGKIIEMNNASANVLTIPANASVAFPVDTRIDIVQGGAGTTSVSITTDTLNGETVSRGQYNGMSLWKKSSTVWVIFGGTT
jgi:hypothetical protein